MSDLEKIKRHKSRRRKVTLNYIINEMIKSYESVGEYVDREDILGKVRRFEKRYMNEQRRVEKVC